MKGEGLDDNFGSVIAISEKGNVIYVRPLLHGNP